MQEMKFIKEENTKAFDGDIMSKLREELAQRKLPESWSLQEFKECQITMNII
jgi:hypothetical protein